MKPFTLRALIALGALLVLGALNTAMVGKERIKRSGEVVYLPLAPVDPRSLIQGDYMALRFALTADLERREEADKRSAREGTLAFASVALDGRRVGRLADDGKAPALKLRYRIRHGQVWLGTNAFFFEEGTAERFNGARYGEFRVDRESGEAVLVGLRDDRLAAL
ncbi:MAG: GDYXXLXY domain-containing protein [Burkholderiales bacterium]